MMLKQEEMTTPLFTELGGSTKLENFLIQLSGDKAGTVEIHKTINISGVVSASLPGTWDVTDEQVVAENKFNKTLAIWDGSPKYAFVPGPGTFGRMVTLHVCWVPPGHEYPTSIPEFQRSPGYEVSVCGGTADPSFDKSWRNIPFSTTRHRVIVSNVVKITKPMRLAWFVESSDVGTTRGAGPFFFVRLSGTVQFYGSFM